MTFGHVVTWGHQSQMLTNRTGSHIDAGNVSSSFCGLKASSKGSFVLSVNRR
jgi:hypothetical protein